MKKALLLLIAFSFIAGTSVSQTILLEETFDNNDYNKSFPLVWDGDGLAPHSSISSLFLSASTGSYQPWWILRDSNSSPNMYYGSHSMYTEPGKSDDWMISVPVKIDEAGFVLSFDAQSYCINMNESKLSSVTLYITDYLTDDPSSLPKTPVKVFENIPQGASDAVDGEFTRYSYSLDDYVGKTIYVCFVNENYDKHILCMDNIKISREEVGSIAVVAPNHVTEEVAHINVTLSANTDKDLKNWTVTYDDGITTLTESGELLQSMSSYEFTFEVPIAKGEQRDYIITLTADEMPASKVTGSMACYAFEPFRKVLIEEMTGTWCGYCPAGSYNIDNMLADEEMKEYVVPVAVHSSASMDPMVVADYDKAMGNLYGNSAPLFVFNRRDVSQINASFDTKFDKDNTGSLAYAVRQIHAEPTPVEVKVTGEYIIEENDTIAIKARAAFRSAVPVKKEKYVLSFILVENNVWMPIDAGSWWAQNNYYSAQSGETSYEGDLGGWAYCKKSQEDVRYNDVARGIYDFYGIPNSLPTEMDMGTEYVYEYTIDIPDTKVTNANGKIMRPAIKRDYCELICFVVDVETGEVMNCDKYPMTEVAENRYTVADLVRDKNLSVESITLDKSEAYLIVGEQVLLKATILPENATNKSVTWTSSNTSVATIDANGKVTAVAVGEATIKATTADGSNKSATCKVTVTSTLATSITLDYTEYEMVEKAEFQLTATILPESTKNKGVVWSSSDAWVASVDANGLVRAYSVGEAVITATTIDGTNLSATCKVTVVPTLAETITLDKTEISIEATETATLVATVLPETTSNKSVEWKSSNDAVATVNNNGEVTAISVGEAIITAITTDGSGVTATCNVTVIPTLAVSIELDQTEASVEEKSDLQLIATILPEHTTNKEVAWSSSDKWVASVDNYGLVTMYSAGEVIITAATTDGTNLSATCRINVYSGIDGVNGDDVIVATVGDNIVVKNAQLGSVVNVYASNGALIASEEATDGSVVVEAPVKGVYVVKVGKQTVKVII